LKSHLPAEVGPPLSSIRTATPPDELLKSVVRRRQKAGLDTTTCEP
jgi:hypothetical protein